MSGSQLCRDSLVVAIPFLPLCIHRVVLIWTSFSAYHTSPSADIGIGYSDVYMPITTAFMGISYIIGNANNGNAGITKSKDIKQISAASSEPSTYTSTAHQEDITKPIWEHIAYVAAQVLAHFPRTPNIVMLLAFRRHILFHLCTLA